VLDRPALSELYEQGKYDVIITELRRRKEAGEMKPEDWRLLGNALDRRWGGPVRGEMLGAYLVAAQNKRVDAVALHNTLVSLGDEKFQDKAIDVLAAWPSSTTRAEDPDELLGQRMREESPRMRHGALKALKARRAPPEVIALAEAAVAVTDVQAWTCDDQITPRGIEVLRGLAESGARDALKKTVPAELTYKAELGRVSDCVKPAQIDALQRALAGALK
jgi:hypothetical protein